MFPVQQSICCQSLQRLNLLLDGKKNITIDAQGSDFIFHGHIQPFTLDKCENITIKNVNIDWEKPLTAEAKVIEADSSHILVQIDTFQFPYKITEKGLLFTAEGWEAEWRLSGGSWLIEINENHIIPANTGDNGCVRGELDKVVYSEKEPGLVLMEGNFTKTPSVGSYLIMRHSTRDHAGMFLFHSKNIQLQNVNVYHTSGLGILSQYCENIFMKNVNMIPNPEKNRYLSSHDDGLHFMGCKGDILIEDCESFGLMDDPMNIHGTCVPVIERVNSTTVKCKFAHDMSKGLIWAKPGDIVGLIYKETMCLIDSVIVDSFNPIDENSFYLSFCSEISDSIGDQFSLENLACTPDVIIRNCYFGSCRARGVLVTTPGEVIIEENVFETSGSAILIAGDANYWYESGAVRNVKIRNNEFKAACNSSPYQFCNAVISIYPEIPKPDPENPFHKNIVIERNTFYIADYPVLYARSVDGLKFINNSLIRSYDYQPWRKMMYNYVIGACKKVEISGNSYSKDLLGKNALFNNMNVEDFILDDELTKFNIQE